MRIGPEALSRPQRLISLTSGCLASWLPSTRSARSAGSHGIKLLDGHDREQVVHRVAQGDVGADAQSGVRRHGERDRHGEERAVGQPHLGQHAAEIGFAHEAVDRGERARGEHLQVADGPRRNLQRRQGAGVLASLGQLPQGEPSSRRDGRHKAGSTSWSRMPSSATEYLLSKCVPWLPARARIGFKPTAKPSTCGVDAI